MVLSAATLAKDTPLSVVSVDTLGKDPIIYLVALVVILTKHPPIF